MITKPIIKYNCAINAVLNLQRFPKSNEANTKPTTLRDYFGDSLGFEHYYRHPRNYNRRGIFSIDEPAPTMRGVNRPFPKGYPGHKSDSCKAFKGIHVLTTHERSLIQTFPENFKWCGNKTDVEQMIGNAVPVRLAQFVAECVIKTISSVLR
ncbi:MAG: DNA cytosine methyltransferase [Thermoguttaceae bacterium]|nr:DNA cytosine methyltransferase [Thermoguttaceae bacterium]